MMRHDTPWVVGDLSSMGNIVVRQKGWSIQAQREPRFQVALRTVEFI